MSLVELMVAVVIGMLGVLVIFTVMSRFEPQKRTTTAGSDANVSGAYAMYELTRGLRLGGYGFATSTGVLGCMTDFRPVPGVPRTLLMTPVLIEDGGAGADSIIVAYGNGDSLAMPVPVASAGSLNNPTILLSGNIGFFAGDVVAIGLSGNPTCMTTTLAPGLVVGSQVPTAGPIPHGGGQQFGPMGVPAFAGSAEVVNLGNAPVVTRYSVTLDGERGLLRATDLLRAAAGAAANDGSSVADGVVNLQAQYGIDTNGDDVVDSWVEPTGPWLAATLRADPNRSTLLRQIKSIRIGLLLRSAQYERPDASGNCTTSAAALEATPLLQGTPAAAGTPAMPASAATAARADMLNYRCFRHRTMETVVPIRNMTWSTL